MRLLLLSDPGSIHTIRWAKALSDRGIEVHIYGFRASQQEDYRGFDIKIHSEEQRGPKVLSKFFYLTHRRTLKKIIEEIKPDILHAHYASSYGLLGRLVRFRPLIISVWGSDVFLFPRKSIFHRILLQANLTAADIILSTSSAMAKEVKRYVPTKEVIVTPFGIDTAKFRRIDSGTEKKEIVIGTVKTLTKNYGIDNLIHAFHLLNVKYPLEKFRLIIAGEGRERTALEKLAYRLGLTNVEFVGKVSHTDVPQLLNRFDLFAALSNSESFGVAVIEASACELPVVVSDVGGLPEVVDNAVTGFVVPARSPIKAFLAMEKIIFAPSELRQMGIAGRQKVLREYDWKNNVDQMMAIYYNIASRR